MALTVVSLEHPVDAAWGRVWSQAWSFLYTLTLPVILVLYLGGRGRSVAVNLRPAWV